MLIVKDLKVSYGALRAVNGVTIVVHEGEIVGLIGPNGAGKSSLLAGIVGLVQPTGGEVIFAGRGVTGLRPHMLAEQGLVLVPEGRRIFPRMSVYENLLMGAYLVPHTEVVQQRLAFCYGLFPILKSRGTQMAGTLSGGEQQMLAIAMGLMANPRLMMLDEPSLGLSPIVIHEIRDVLLDLRAMGVTILLAEQNARLATDLADRIYVMQSGSVIIHGTPASLMGRHDIVERYMGVR